RDSLSGHRSPSGPGGPPSSTRSRGPRTRAPRPDSIANALRTEVFRSASGGGAVAGAMVWATLRTIMDNGSHDPVRRPPRPPAHPTHRRSGGGGRPRRRRGSQHRRGVAPDRVGGVGG